MFNFRAFNQGKIIGLLCVIQCVTQCLSKLQCVTQYTVPVKIGNLGLPEAISPGVKGTYCTFITSFDILAVLQQNTRRVNLYTLAKFNMKILTNCVEQVFTAWGRPWLCKIVFYSVTTLWVVTKLHVSTPSIHKSVEQVCTARGRPWSLTRVIWVLGFAPWLPSWWQHRQCLHTITLFSCWQIYMLLVQAVNNWHS